MEVRFHHPGAFFFAAAIWVLVIVLGIIFRKVKKKNATLRVANTKRLKALPIYRRKRMESAVLKVLAVLVLTATIAFATILFARPFKRDTNKEDKKRRDIFICMDISASSYKGVDQLLDQVKEMIPQLDGDRIGISLFNTSSMQYVPVTDDYEFVLQRVEELKKYFEAEAEFADKYVSKYEFAYEIPEAERARYDELNKILSSFDQGTTAGYESKGTSVVSEGLASCLFGFPELHEEKRSRTVVLITDNNAQLIGDPLVTLEGAIQMCTDDQVKVIGIYPGTDEAAFNLAKAEEGEEQETIDVEGNKQAFKTGVESAKGLFLDGSDVTAKQILDAIRTNQMQSTKTATSTKDTDIPTIWMYWLFGSFLVVTLLTIIVLARNKFYLLKHGKKLKKIFATLLYLVMVALMVLIWLRPMVIDKNVKVSVNNLDVCFVVDTTISMWGDDYSGSTRMEGVQKDIQKIMDELPDANFGLIRFDNGAQILQPYTQDINAVKESIKDLSMPAYATASGSSMNTSYEAIKSMVSSDGKKADGRKKIVFIFSDGETTDGSKLQNFKELEKDVDGGAVIGYGTSKGGRMNLGDRGYIQDNVKGIAARSKIDEKSLKQIAKELGVEYVHSTKNGYSKIASVVSSVNTLSRETALAEGNTEGFKETYYLFAGGLAILMLLWLFRTIRKGGLL